MAETARPERILIKKYANRRLYDTHHSRYVNLKQIAELVKEGHTVEVVDATTGEDLTKVILTQIILEEEKDRRDLLPVGFLHQLIQYGESAYEEFLQSVFSAGMAAYRNAQEQMEAVWRTWMGPWATPPTPDQEIETLKRRIAELEERLAERDRKAKR
ncbi:MAG: pesticin [Candidatus Dadabacteria bacterium]|nr:MAG: pesticin [Candidatus Dadabacteria bacterium]